MDHTTILSLSLYTLQSGTFGFSYPKQLYTPHPMPQSAARHAVCLSFRSLGSCRSLLSPLCATPLATRRRHRASARPTPICHCCIPRFVRAARSYPLHPQRSRTFSITPVLTPPALPFSSP